MQKKGVAILGSTGSIGTQALEVVRANPNLYTIDVLTAQNNADLLIEEFLNSNSNKKLVVVGDTPYNDSFTNKLKSLASDKLIFTGYVKNQDELLSLYQHCFAYLHGHEFGGTNPAMLKAMAYKCAILALDTVFNREMLSEGVFGVFFEKSKGSLKNKIEEIENKPNHILLLKEKVENGITDKYRWDNVVNQYINLVKKLLGNNT